MCSIKRVCVRGKCEKIHESKIRLDISKKGRERCFGVRMAAVKTTFFSFCKINMYESNGKRLLQRTLW